MENLNPPSPNVKHSFLLDWMMLNIVGLPILLAPYAVGFFLLMIIVILSDGGSVPSTWYIFSFIILALSGAVMGTWLGLTQSLALKTRVPQSSSWIRATAFGVAIGSPVSWLIYRWIFDSPLVNRPNGVYFSFWYEYITFGVLLGLSIGVAQWTILRRHVEKAQLWIVALPILFTFSMAFANFGKISSAYVKSIYRLIQFVTHQPPRFILSSGQVFLFYSLLTPLLALVVTSILSGIFLDWLFQKKSQE